MISYPHVRTEWETLQAAHDGISLSRFGDGELKICLGRDAKSQQHHPELSAALCRILLEPGGPCLPCIPRPIKGGPKAGFWQPYLARKEILRLYRAQTLYGSAFVTRPDSAPEIDAPAYWARLRALWEGRDVVLVRGSEKSLTKDRLPGARSVVEIVGPVQHAWAARKDLRARLRGERRRVILCLGATASVLAWELAQEGGHALDLGHAGMFTKRIGADGIVGVARRNDKD